MDADGSVPSAGSDAVDVESSIELSPFAGNPDEADGLLQPANTIKRLASKHWLMNRMFMGQLSRVANWRRPMKAYRRYCKWFKRVSAVCSRP